jgi:phosphoserine phosphatase
MEASEDGQTLTGRVLGDIVDGLRKKHLLEHIASIYDIPFEQVLRFGGSSNEKVIAVGDGANDLLMLQRASLGVAYNGKPKLQENVCLRPISLTRRLRHALTIPALHCSSTFSDSRKKSKNN